MRRRPCPPSNNETPQKRATQNRHEISDVHRHHSEHPKERDLSDSVPTRGVEKGLLSGILGEEVGLEGER